VLFSRVFCRRVLDHGCDHVVVTDVPVGRNLPVLAVPGLDAPGARAFVVGARHLDRLEHVLETELLEAVGADVEKYCFAWIPSRRFAGVFLYSWPRLTTITCRVPHGHIRTPSMCARTKFSSNSTLGWPRLKQ